MTRASTRLAWRYTLPAPTGRRDLTAARLWAAGAAGVWERTDDVVAWFVDNDAAVPDGGAWTPEPDRDWQEAWKATVAPVSAGRVTIVPSWLAHDHAVCSDEVVIVLDPGRAFGSGNHATTMLCLEALQAREVAVAGRQVLDVGTGTGVLGIAALRLGAAEVVGVDVDADAVAVATDNARRNGTPVDLRVGSVAAVGGRAFDLVVANLVTDTLVGLADDLAAAVRPGGWLVASGIAVDRGDLVVDALTHRAAWGAFTVEARDGWAAIRGRRA